MTGKNLEPLRWRNGVLEVIDQTLLPAKLAYVRLGDVGQVCAAIKTMKVRGAPLIGVVGAYGLVLSVKKVKTRDLAGARTQLRKWADLLIQTRPLLQGSRLTAFELAHDKIPVKIIVDSATAQMMARGAVDKILVGADRILKTGHVTNKIGTLPIALSAKFYGVPFYVAAPVSTVDMVTDPSRVVIEERNQREVLYVAGRRVAPRSVEALNPAFDVTPPELVTSIVTDRGMAGPPFVESLRSLSR